MSPLNVVLSTLASITVLMHFGNSFEKIKMNREIGLIITVTTCLIFAANYIREIITAKKEKQ
ncbi:MAG: hypothetical protein CVV49_05835 [Spirochaetae bacterium HGW-Spirochaetae-5]|nr:MAG: hypothetical protein CVV49_05835 [Spirochaetae bacterium HGW-Spirochaetae-5]